MFNEYDTGDSHVDTEPAHREFLDRSFALDHITPESARFADTEIAPRFVLHRRVVPDENVMGVPIVLAARRILLGVILE